MKFAVYGADGTVLRWGYARTLPEAKSQAGPGERVAVVSNETELNGAKIESGTVVPPPPPENPVYDDAAAQNWTLRNRLVNTSLWAVSRGSPLTEENQAEWEDYISALHSVDVHNPVWPEQPAIILRSK